MSNFLIATNPANSQKIGQIESTNLDEIPQKVQKSKDAFNRWSMLDYESRSRYIKRLKTLIISRLDEIARIITISTGKPIVETYTTELFPTLLIIDYYLKEARHLLKKQHLNIGIFNLFVRKSLIRNKPIGSVAIISPWNYPFMISLSETIAALLVGCTVILKPSEHTTLVGQMIEDLFSSCKLPDSVMQLVHGDSRHGQLLIESRPDKIIFTGSTQTGKKILQHCSKYLIPTVLELGGKNPCIVFADANLSSAAEGIIWGTFLNSGQACAAIGRLYVESKIADKFIGMLVEKTRALKQGDPMDPQTDIGPLTTDFQLEKVKQIVEDALKNGAKILIGGKRNEKHPGYYFEPTIITNVNHSMKIMKEEIFGPVLPVMQFERLEDSIKLANNSSYTLSASIWTGDAKKADFVSENLTSRSIVINDCSYSYGICQAPWGGSKDSGFGTVHSRLGLQEFTIPVHINKNLLTCIRSFWWHPYSNSLRDFFKGTIMAIFGRDYIDKLKGLSRMLANFLMSACCAERRLGRHMTLGAIKSPFAKTRINEPFR